MFSNLISPSISGFIFERNDPPQRQPLSFAQRMATFQPMSSPLPVSFAKPSGNGLNDRFWESSRMSARAKSAPTAADQLFANVQAKFALKFTAARFDSREMYRPSKVFGHSVFSPNGEVSETPQA